jgi:hypothetical protein
MVKRPNQSGGPFAGQDRTKRASMALDELVWSLQDIKLDQIRDAANALREIISQSASSTSTSASAVARGYQSVDPNKRFLIGVLPRLFQDRSLFPQNEDIADFAAAALELPMNRTEKRSRYEIIGKVVCETDDLDEHRLSTLVSALERLVGNKERLTEMAARKKSGNFSWNETIQELLKS